jgi:hypothetical protein
MNAPKVVTVETLHQSTAQEVFDHISYHLLTQKAKSMASDGVCLYFNPGTLMKCAAGCLFTEAEYKLWFEGRSWRVLVSEKHVPEHHQKLITAVQNIHDGVPVVQWTQMLQTVAREYNLNPTYCQG